MTPKIGYFYNLIDTKSLVSVTAAGPNLVAILGVNCTANHTLTLEQFQRMYTEYNP